MSFKVLFIAHSPDANYKEDRSIIETELELYSLQSVVVKDQLEALVAAREIHTDSNLDCVLLCPGFSNKDVTEVSHCLGDGVAVAVCRTDGPGGRITANARKREGYPKE